MKDVLGNHIKDLFFHLGSLVEYHPIPAKDPVTNPSIWKENFTWIVPRIRFCTRGEFGRVTC